MPLPYQGFSLVESEGLRFYAVRLTRQPRLEAAMQYPPPPESRRVDSISPSCYVTVATSICEIDLDRMEAAHLCNPERLRY